jgi:NAD(P)-dependent dehydrogenase (short-subunit alcohol dehydrogenase family)
MKVLVTGGTGGLGLAMASALAAAGATVALSGRSGRRASSVAAELPGAVGISWTCATSRRWPGRSTRHGGGDQLMTGVAWVVAVHAAPHT